MASELASGFEVVGEEGWRALASEALKGAPLDTLRHETEDGVRLAPVQPARRTATPVLGQRTGRPWRVVERIDDPDLARGSAQARDALANGAAALSLVGRDAPSAHGYGVPTDGKAIERLFDGVDLDSVALRIEPHPEGRVTAEALAERLVAAGLASAEPEISFGLDPVGCFARYGGLPLAWPETQAALRAGCENLAARGFAGPFVEADGRIYHEAGASNAEELAAVLASALAYLKLLSADRPMADAAVGIGFTLTADQAPFETIAKLRALRLLWRRLLETVDSDLRIPARLHVETSRRMLTAADPQTNLVRTTIAAFVAAASGADSLSVLPYSAARGLPESGARRLARNVQLLLVEESNLHRFADPAAGSGALEALTDGLCETAWSIFRAIEGEGGIVDSLAAGRLQERIERTAARRRDAVTRGEETIIGVTVHPEQAPRAVPLAPAETWPDFRMDEPALACRPLAPVSFEEWAAIR